ncbi:MAG: hypothetical protein IPL99_25245 [Candidatus Competibacteraceae bacterium]|nr:hypothetical protein [Candidatus Competibacteraceae bacterium]
MSAALGDVLALLKQATGHPPKRNGAGWISRCPAHDDHTPSLSVAEGENGKILLHCHAGCDYPRIIAALGIAPELTRQSPQNDSRRLVTTYPYCDASGVEVRQKLRYAPKDFRIRHRDESGAWVYKTGPGPAVLYRFPDVKAAIAQGATVFIAEGEKDVDRLVAGGLVATCNIEGASQAGQKPKWRKEYTAQLAGAARVVLLPDNDEPGRAHMQAIAQALRGKVGEVRIVELPELPDKGDVSDWLNAGHPTEELLARVEQTPAFAPIERHEPSADHRETLAKAIETLKLPTVSPCTHLANSHRIRHYFKGQIWYALGVGWVMWTGKFWRPDPTSEGSIATGFVDSLSRLIAKESSILSRNAADEADEDRRKALMTQAEALLKWAVQSENERTISAGLKLTKHALLLEYSALNADPWLFNVQNGTIDLRTGKLRPHHPADLSTFLAPVTFDPAATCPTFERFVLEVFAGDADMAAFIQRAMGWSLTGVVKERALFFLYGDTGKNGKTTLVEVIMKLVGVCGESSYGYGRKVGADTFMKSKNQDDNQRKAATLAGPRFICTSEVDEEHRLNEQLIKDITGGDTIEGRRLYQEAFTFKPQFKPWMYGNHKPEIRGTDDAIWSRVRLVPFEVSFKGREDLNLPDKLEAELPGILNWAIRGCLDWQRHGLRPPAKVQAATQAYRDEMDVFGPFIAECCVLHPHAEVKASDLWTAYNAWCDENGFKEQSQTKLGKYLNSKGIRIERSNGIRRMGIGLLNKHHSDSDPVGTVGTVGTVVQKIPYEEPPIGTFPSNPSKCSNPSNVDIDTLVQGLSSQWRGHDTATLINELGWSESRWITVKNQALAEKRIEFRVGSGEGNCGGWIAAAGML